MELTEKLGWLADKIPAFGGYGKDCANTMRRAADEITKLRAELAAAAKEAERYRWMVSDEGGDVLYETLTGVYAEKKDVDAAIDAAMKG